MESPQDYSGLIFTSGSGVQKKYAGPPRKPLKTVMRSVSSPIPDVLAHSPDSSLAFTFEIEPKPLEEFPFLREPTQTTLQLEEKIIKAHPPGQWFRRHLDQKTDITCLPAEIHIEILKNVGFLDQLACERVCTTWRTIIRRDCAGFRYTTIGDSSLTGINEREESPNRWFDTSTLAKRKSRPETYKKPKLLVHRFLQDGNFAFRQIPGSSSVEVMSTFFPDHPHGLPRRFKIANLTFLNDPIAIYDTTTFRYRSDIPSLIVEFDPEPLRNEFRIRIGGHFSTANTAEPVQPALPTPWPGQFAFPHGRRRNRLYHDLETTHARDAMARNMSYTRPWGIGAFLLGIHGKLESQHHWYEDTAIEQNERWNGRKWEKKHLTGVDYDGDWDMDNGFREPLTLQQIAIKEQELLEKYKRNGYWFMREWKKDQKIDEMHVALTPVSEWIWEICY
ncbi:hypothetical protein ABW20_dc0105222 [Dactylellina cionopaga]|nr:hypothetical protein ABW20_dc0105222 [Dactylellina cionopaga]